MTWFLDGNNMLALALGGRRGPDDRERLLRRLSAFRLPSPYTIVFDGPPPEASPSREKRLGKAFVIYAGGRTADEVILRRVRPGDHVVTADRDLGLKSRDRGAKVMKPSDFLSGLKPKGGGHRSEKPTSTAVDVDEWLRFFGEDPGASGE